MKYKATCKRCKKTAKYLVPKPHHCKLCGSRLMHGISLWMRLAAAWRAFWHPVRDYVEHKKKMMELSEEPQE